LGPKYDDKNVIKEGEKRVIGKDIELWSPITGECFFFEHKEINETICGIPVLRSSSMDVRILDPVCPLKHIYCIIGTDNIYANV